MYVNKRKIHSVMSRLLKIKNYIALSVNMLVALSSIRHIHRSGDYFLKIASGSRFYFAP